MIVSIIILVDITVTISMEEECILKVRFKYWQWLYIDVRQPGSVCLLCFLVLVLFENLYMLGHIPCI